MSTQRDWLKKAILEFYRGFSRDPFYLTQLVGVLHRELVNEGKLKKTMDGQCLAVEVEQPDEPLAEFTEITVLDVKEQQFAKESAIAVWGEMQDKFVGVALESAILKVIEESVSFGMLKIKSESSPDSNQVPEPPHKTLFVRKLMALDLTAEQIAGVLKAIDSTCNSCWDDEAGCRCWDDS